MTTRLTEAPASPAPVLSPRGEIYAQLAEGFSFPDEEFYGSVRSGRWTAELGATLSRLPCRVRLSGLRWTAPSTYEEMQTEYIRLFQVGGRRGPPCPLHEGHYTRDRSQTLQSTIRFYNFFGFRVVECVMPDHLSVQLEFMSELAATGDDEVQSLLRAERDFLRTHLLWTSELAGRVAAARPEPFYRSLTAISARLVAADRLFIADLLGGRDG